MRPISCLPDIAAAVRRPAAVVLALAMASLVPGGAAHAGSDDYKYEWKQGDCKYSYSENRHGYKEEYKCKREAAVRPKYKYETRYDDCRYKYEESTKGYKEELKCKSARRPMAGGRYWPKHAKQGPATLVGAPFGIDLGNCNRQAIGALLGGAAGAYAGSQFGDGKGQMAATAVGTLVGVIVGSEIGRRMDEVDRTCAGQVFEQAPDNRTIEWQNPNEGAQYRVTPSRTFSDNGGRQCREYQATVMVGGRQNQGYGTACRQPDGSWQIVR